MYKMIIFKKGADSSNLQYDDILQVYKYIVKDDIEKYIRKMVTSGLYQLADYKFVEMENE